MFLENTVEKGGFAQNEPFHIFPQCFLGNLYLKILQPFSPLYTHLNTLKKKALGKHCGEKGGIAQNEQFHLFPQCFLNNLYLKSFNSHILVAVCSFFEFGTV